MEGHHDLDEQDAYEAYLLDKLDHEEIAALPSAKGGSIRFKIPVLSGTGAKKKKKKAANVNEL